MCTCQHTCTPLHTIPLHTIATSTQCQSTASTRLEVRRDSGIRSLRHMEDRDLMFYTHSTAKDHSYPAEPKCTPATSQILTLFMTHFTVEDRIRLGKIKLNELGKQKLGRRSLPQSYFLTHYRLRKKEPFTALGSHLQGGPSFLRLH